MLYKGQCRRKCSLSSVPVPQTHTGLEQVKLCLNQCPFKAPNKLLYFLVTLERVETAVCIVLYEEKPSDLINRPFLCDFLDLKFL